MPNALGKAAISPVGEGRLTALGVAAALTPSLAAAFATTTTRGRTGDAGFRDGSFTNALFRDPRGLAVDAAGGASSSPIVGTTGSASSTLLPATASLRSRAPETPGR
jgi:hypothetical protein